MTDFLRYSVSSGGAGGCNSLEGIRDYQNDDVALVQEKQRYYRFFAASTLTPDGDKVVLPINILSSSPGRWIQQGGPSVAGPNPGQPFSTACANDADGRSAFDYILTSYADLLQVTKPVAGVFTLPSGSYAVKEGFTLPDDERMQIAAGSFVFMVGMAGVGTIITGNVDVNALLTISAGSIVDLLNLTLVNNGNIATVSSGGTVTARACRFTNNGPVGTSTALAVSGATFRGSQNVYTAQNAYAVVHNGGILRESNSNIISNNANGYLGHQSASIANFTDCQIFGNALDGIQAFGSSLYLCLTDCKVQCGANSRDCIKVSGLLSLSISGGRLTTSSAGSGRNGISFDGDCTRTTIRGVRIDTLNTGITRTAGTQGHVVGSELDIDSSVATGWNWAAASIPTDGLAIFTNSIGSATPFNGFDRNDARVNIKGCLGSGVLLQETPIVV